MRSTRPPRPAARRTWGTRSRMIMRSMGVYQDDDGMKEDDLAVDDERLEWRTQTSRRNLKIYARISKTYTRRFNIYSGSLNIHGHLQALYGLLGVQDLRPELQDLHPLARQPQLQDQQPEPQERHFVPRAARPGPPPGRHRARRTQVPLIPAGRSPRTIRA